MGSDIGTMGKTGALVLAFVLVSINGDGLGSHGHSHSSQRIGKQEAPVEGYAQPAQSQYEGDLADAASGAGSELDSLQMNIPGVPGEDYPIYSEVPETGFSCEGQVDGGYYGDPEAECQAFHICTADGAGGLAKYSFLCPNGTLFNQNYFICDWWFNFDCSTAEELYSLNDDIAAEREALAGAADAPGEYGAPIEEEYAAADYPEYEEVATEAVPAYEAAATYESEVRSARRLGGRRNNRRGGRRRGARRG